MDDNGSGQLGFQNISERMLNCPSSGLNNALPEKVAGMATSSMAMFKSPHGGEPPYGSDWGPIVSMSHSENFGGSSMASYGGFANPSNPILLENRGMSNRSHLVHYPADPNLTEISPKLSVFGSGNFSQMINSFCLTGYGQTSDAIGPPNYASNKSGGIDNDSIDAAQAHGDFHISEERVVGASPNGKRKASDPSSLLDPNENAEGDSEKDLSGETSEQKEVFEKKQKIKQNSEAKQKEAKDDPKANYIHVRARRGQATNSHSLAERVRREKISERMRLLQELVPGCNKITGKAVMLDEIINYVQSLQQQVEFLSMKLATVNPELNFAIDQILSKDILHARGGGTSIVGFNSGMSSTHPYSQGFHLGGVLGVSTTTSQYHPIPQAIWDSDLQTVLHTGFDSNPTVGSSETEL